MPILWGLGLLAAAAPAVALQDTTRIRRLFEIEDARPRDPAALAPLTAAAASRDSVVARWAVRGLGRQQRPDLLPVLEAALAHSAPGVRIEAANGIAQSAQREGTAEARRAIGARIQLERDVRVLNALLRSLGRLPPASAEERDITEAILVSKAISTGAAEGAMLGLASLYRRTARAQPPSAAALEQVVRVLRNGRPMARRSAMAAIVASGKTDSTTLHLAMKDDEREVRRLAALAAFIQADLPGRDAVIQRARRDSVGAVRYEAVRAAARYGDTSCDPILSATDDADTSVQLVAIDLLAGCGKSAIPRLSAIAREPIVEDRWHRPAHALIAAARLDSAAASALLPAFTSSRVWWARMYAARAADTARLVPALMTLARDPHPNVREAAISGLRRRVGHAADSLYLAALESNDYQLLLTAAEALDSTTDSRAPAALLAALARLTAERRETSRDPRIAMLNTLVRIGGADQALRSYASDFDTTVAATAAGTGTATPRPLPRRPVPSWSDLVAWDRLVAVITMRDGGVARMKLRPFDAPTNVARFVRMAREGWFNGLTWHRVAPNFVVQGGSPGANEYMGDGPFTRDELTLGSHVRGTVGISTRGRDTGDGQLFFNLIDNWRLDHDYTIIGEIIAGMDVVDAWQEGAVIERVDLLEETR